MRFNRALPILPFLAACAAPADQYPSLAMRPAELAIGAPQPEPEPYVPPATPAAVLERLEQLTAQAAAAHQAFLAAAPGARRAVSAGRGAAQGSEAWALAQTALGGLEAARAPAPIALAELDRLYVDAAVEQSAIDRIGAARETVAQQVEEQDSTIAELAR